MSFVTNTNWQDYSGELRALGGIIVPFIGIKVIDLLLMVAHLD